MDWVPVNEWRPHRKRRPRSARKPWKWGRLSLAAAGLAWLLPILILSWQVSRAAGDAAFQEAPRHTTAWLEAQVGPPQRVLPYNRSYRIWCYTRGSYEVECAVDKRGIVRGVSYSRL